MTTRRIGAAIFAPAVLPSAGTWGRLCRTVALCVALLVGATTAVLAGETIVYSEGFETTNGGYTHAGTNDVWAWGVPNYAPGPDAHAGTKCWGTNLTGVVPADADMYLVSPPIPVPALGANEIARVRFWGWISIDDMSDRGGFQVSSDGSSWTSLAEFFNQMQGGWSEYSFDVSSYAGCDLYLRWRCYTDDQYGEQPGFYIDDVAVTISTLPSTRTTFTLEAWEQPGGSCPWICPWDGKNYVQDNDVYSTARGAEHEYRDFYLLQKPLVAKGGKYLLQLRETDREMSYTDLAQLMVVDHPKGSRVAPDDQGNVRAFASPRAPASARDGEGSDVSAALAAEDGVGVKVFDGSTLDLDFSNLDVTQGATLVLRAKGFLTDGPQGAPTGRPPRIEVLTQDVGGVWASHGVFYPRMESALCAYDLKPFLAVSRKVRLAVNSCHVGKYHLIDYAALDTAPQASVTTALLAPASAVCPAEGDVSEALSAADSSYVTLSPQSAISMAFPVPKKAAGNERSFVVVSKGYYIPGGTFYIYTWDGSTWAQRDGWTVANDADQTRTFDLSLWLPDSTGQYRVRIWQDYAYEPAGIDYVALSRGAIEGTLSTATDLRGPTSVLTELGASDDNRLDWSGEEERDRWAEAVWTGFSSNTPPTTNPVVISDPMSATPSINWTYTDATPQTQFEVQVWTGPGGTGTCVWNPAVGDGAATSVTYDGTALVQGQTYYARVRAFDGDAWGGWSEGSWTYNAPTAARAIKQNVCAYLMEDLPPADPKVSLRIYHAFAHVQNSLAGRLWADDDHLTRAGSEVFHQESLAVKDLLPLLNTPRLDPNLLADVQSAIDDLVLADKALADTAISEAEPTVGASRQPGPKASLKRARQQYEAGLADADAGRYCDAIAHFQAAWSSAQQAIRQNPG